MGLYRGRRRRNSRLHLLIDKSRSGDGKASIIGPDTAFQMEFLYSREEIRVRMDYNRRLLAGQVTLIAALIAGGLSLIGKDGSINSVMMQVISVAVVWINAAFILENTVNNSHIALAAVFMHNVLNKRYALSSEGSPVHVWELFLSLERQLSKNHMNKNFFIIDAALLLNVMLTGVALCSFYIAVRQPNFHLSRLALTGFIFGTAFVGYAYKAHFSANTLWKMLITPDEAAEFKDSMM